RHPSRRRQGTGDAAARRQGADQDRRRGARRGYANPGAPLLGLYVARTTPIRMIANPAAWKPRNDSPRKIIARTVPNTGRRGRVKPAAFAPTTATPRFQQRKAPTEAASAT